MKRFLAVFLCLSLLLGGVTVLAEGKGSESTPRADVTDVNPPDLISITCKEKNLKPGDVLHVQVKVDDRSDIANVHVQFYNQAKDVFISLDLHYDAKSDMFTGEYAMDKTNVNGTYLLNWVTASDKYNNAIQIGAWKKGFARFKLSGASSGTYKGTVKLKENGKTVKAGNPLHVEIKLSKPAESAFSALVWFYREDKPGFGTGYFIPSLSSKEFSGLIYFNDNPVNGKYILNRVVFQDEYGNDLGGMDVSGVSFTMTGGSKDKTPPTVSSATLKEKNKTLKPGDMIHVSAKIKDQSEISYASATLADKNFYSYWEETGNDTIVKRKDGFGIQLTYNKSTKKWEGSGKLPEDLPNGQYILEIFVRDSADNYISKAFDKQSVTFNGPDYVDEGIKAFITQCYSAISGKAPSDSDVQQFGLLLASGRTKAVNVIRDLMAESGLNGGEAAAKALWQIMQGKSPSSSELAKTVTALKTGLDYGIDSLNNAAFRQRCKDWGIKPGNLGTKAADTQVSSVDVDGGRYTLNGSKATLTGVTDTGIKSLVIPATVSANGKTYKVTAIDSAACRNLAKLTSVTIGKNVTTISPDAFSGCKKLKTITISGTKLKAVGANAFANISSKATFKCPKKQLEKYKKLIQKNAPKKAKFK